VVKYRLTVMSVDNANRDQLKSVVRIARVLRTALRRFIISSFHVSWRSTKKNWTSGPTFTEYLSEVLNCKVIECRNEKFGIQILFFE
jgi:hypothetical protein